MAALTNELGGAGMMVPGGNPLADVIVSGLPANDRRVSALRGSAAAHRSAGVASVTGAHYEGGHWLGSFAVYLVTGRGLPRK